MHGSELNRTDETRFVVSFRMAFGKPQFPNRHFHKYVNADMVGTPLGFAASLPAMAQGSYPRSFVRRVREKILNDNAPEAPVAPPEAIGDEQNGKIVVALRDMPIGVIRGLTESICAVRFSETEAIATTRRCPHAGGDLANGWTTNGALVCPWHNLPFDARTGKAPCKSLAPLRVFHCEISGEKLIVDPARIMNSSDA